MNEKVKHVLKAKQFRDHFCHWPGCNVEVPPALWGCRRHWYMLPKKIRDKIWETYVIGQEETFNVSEEYIKAAEEAQEWIKKNC